MIFDHFDGLNWLAVLVATLAWYAFSTIWYSAPPMSKVWQAAAKVAPQEGPPLPSLITASLVLYFVATVVIALVVTATATDTVKEGLALGATLGLGFGVVGGIISQGVLQAYQLTEQKGGAYWLIGFVHAIAGWSIVTVILALWA
jgi:uncharacterized membrane protein YeaQ/YmgE (transglycosylase-associated protein family)